MTRTFALHAMLILLAAGCGGSATQKTPDAETTPEGASTEAASGATMNLIGSEWLLEDIAGDGVLNNVQATLAFPEPGRIAGSGSCNRFNGPCTLGDIAVMGGEGGSDGSGGSSGSGGIGRATFSVGPLATTRKACVPAVGEQEQRYLAALQAAERIEIEGRTLRVYTKGAVEPLRYARITP
jgi:heat shock protein HslJ